MQNEHFPAIFGLKICSKIKGKELSEKVSSETDSYIKWSRSVETEHWKIAD
jgi:hypothetical protein